LAILPVVSFPKSTCHPYSQSPKELVSLYTKILDVLDTTARFTVASRDVCAAFKRSIPSFAGGRDFMVT
jgi:hypothetical protein